MLRHLKAYEARKPKQHLLLLSPDGWVPGGWRLPPEERFTQSPADFIATANSWIDKADPKVHQLGKPVMMDMDHVEWFDTLKPGAREVGSMVAQAGLHRFQPPGPGAVLLLTPAGRSNLSQ